MYSFYRIPDPGPETEAQRERALYLRRLTRKTWLARRRRWQSGVRVLKRLFHTEKTRS